MLCNKELRERSNSAAIRHNDDNDNEVEVAKTGCDRLFFFFRGFCCSTRVTMMAAAGYSHFPFKRNNNHKDRLCVSDDDHFIHVV